MTARASAPARTATLPPAFGPGRAGWSLVAAGLLLGSAALQLVASLERWVVIRGAWDREDRSIEDHLFDYSYPADPWEPLGSSAVLFGAGYLLLALGVLALGRVIGRRIDDPGKGSIAAGTRMTGAGAFDGLLVGVVAVAFGIDGLHALASGILRVPSPVQFVAGPLLVLSAIAGIALVTLAVRRMRASWPTAVACLLLLGATLPGYLVAAFAVAPAVNGYQSFDTTPWTETVVAAAVAGAGVMMLVAAAAADIGSAAAARQVQKGGWPVARR